MHKFRDTTFFIVVSDIVTHYRAFLFVCSRCKATKLLVAAHRAEVVRSRTSRQGVSYKALNTRLAPPLLLLLLLLLLLIIIIMRCQISWNVWWKWNGLLRENCLKSVKRLFHFYYYYYCCCYYYYYWDIDTCRETYDENGVDNCLKIALNTWNGSSISTTSSSMNRRS